MEERMAQLAEQLADCERRRVFAQRIATLCAALVVLSLLCIFGVYPGQAGPAHGPAAVLPSATPLAPR